MPALLPILWSAATSQFGVLLIVGVAAYGYGHHRASVACAEREVAAHARSIQMHAEEMIRQAKAADAIAMVDRERAGLASQAANAMQAEIDALKTELARKVPGHAKAKDCDCAIDAEFARRVKKIDRYGNK